MSDHTRCYCGSEDFQVIQNMGERCVECGLWLERYDGGRLKDFSTSSLVNELRSRVGNGVEVINVDPHVTVDIPVEGAAIVLVITD